MQIEVFTIFDVQADRAITPIFRGAEEVAIRDFKNSVAAADSPFNKNPDDYVLYHIDTWDDKTMMFVGEQEPRRIMNGREAIADRKVDVDKIKELADEIEKIKANLDGQPHTPINAGGTL